MRIVLKYFFVLSILFQTELVYSQYSRDCMTFNFDLSIIQANNINYVWVIEGKGKSVESINFIIDNNSDNVIDEIKYKLTIFDPNGKTLYSKAHSSKESINGRGKSARQSIFFDKPLKSKWSFVPNTHPLKLEVIEIKQNKKSTAEYIAWQIYNKMDGCPENQIENGCKQMLQIYPNIIKERIKESTVDWVFRKYEEFFDEKLKKEKELEKQRVKQINELNSKGNSKKSIGNYQEALDIYLQLLPLINNENPNDRTFKDIIYTSVSQCYKELHNYEKAADVNMLRSSAGFEDSLSSARDYYRTKIFNKSLVIYSAITNRNSQIYNQVKSKYYDNPIFSGEDWNNYKECILKLKLKASSETEKNSLIQSENEMNSRIANYNKIKEEDNKIRKIIANTSSFYKIKITQNINLIGYVEIEIFGSSGNKAEFQSIFNDMVISKSYDGSILFNVDKNNVVYFGYKKQFSKNNMKYFKLPMKPGGKVEVGSIWALRNTELESEATPFLIFVTGTNPKIDEFYNMQSNFKVGKIVNGHEIISKVYNLKCDSNLQPTEDVNLTFERILK